MNKETNEYDKGKGIDRARYTCPTCNTYLMDLTKTKCPFGHTKGERNE